VIPPWLSLSFSSAAAEVAATCGLTILTSALNKSTGRENRRDNGGVQANRRTGLDEGRVEVRADNRRVPHLELNRGSTGYVHGPDKLFLPNNSAMYS
jgi:hypothetical protein